MVKKILLILIFLWLASCSIGATFYVRPAGGDYGNEDGTAYADAWDGLQEVVWGGAGVVAGDTLYVCGLHLFAEAPAHSADRNWVIDANGTDDDTRITIRGDHSANAQGIIWGVPTMAGEEHIWSDEGDGTYSTTASNYNGFFFQDVTTASWTILTKVYSIQECKDTPGSYYSATYSYGDPFYAHCTDDGDPNRIVGGINGWHIYLTGREYITFKNIDFYVPIFTPKTDLAYIKWEGCKLWYDYLSIQDGCHHIEIIDCDMAHGKGGLSIQDYTDHGVDGPNDITVSGCYIHDIGIYPIVRNTDAEGIGINGCNNLTIERNEFYNCGAAITTYPYENQRQVNLVIRWNYIHDMHEVGDSRGNGIELDAQSSNVTDKSGCQVYGNIVANAPKYGYSSTWATDQIVFYNNVAYNCNNSFFFNYTLTDYLGPNIVLRNNISLNPTSRHIYFGSDTSDANYTCDSNYNIFYPDGATFFNIKDNADGGAPEWEYTNFAGWQALSKSGCTFDPDSIIDDPLFLSADGGNFKLQSGSPAIDEGVDVGLTEDYAGVSMPQNEIFDIGAHEYVHVPGGGVQYLIANLFLESQND